MSLCPQCSSIPILCLPAIHPCKAQGRVGGKKGMSFSVLLCLATASASHACLPPQHPPSASAPRLPWPAQTGRLLGSRGSDTPTGYLSCLHHSASKRDIQNLATTPGLVHRTTKDYCDSTSLPFCYCKTLTSGGQNWERFAPLPTHATKPW